MTLEASPNPVHEGKTPASLLLRSVVEVPGRISRSHRRSWPATTVNDNGAIDIPEYLRALRR